MCTNSSVTIQSLLCLQSEKVNKFLISKSGRWSILYILVRVLLWMFLTELENEFPSFREARICWLNRIGISSEYFFTIYIIRMESTAALPIQVSSFLFILCFKVTYINQNEILEIIFS